MIYVDTNVVLDVVVQDPQWASWSLDKLADAREEQGLGTGLVVAAELAHKASSQQALEATLRYLSIDLLLAGLDVAWLGGQAYSAYRRRGGERASLLPDLLIGAHAQALGATVLTRDPRRFRTYFPDLPLITPDTDK